MNCYIRERGGLLQQVLRFDSCRCMGSILLLFCVFGFISPVSGQAFQRLTEENGLPTNLCRDLVQDKMGFMWIATESGLVRYDGAQCKIYQPIEGDSTSLSCYAINSLTAGASGNLYVGGNDGYINQYDPEKDVFHRTYIKEINHIPDRRIYGHYEDDTILWMAAEVGLLKHNLNTETTKVINPRIEVKNSNHPYLQTVHGFHQDLYDPNLLWIATRAGLVSLKKNSMEFTFHTQYLPKMTALDKYAILTIYQDKDGLIWVCGAWSGIRSYHPATDKWTYYFSNYYPITDQRNDVNDFIPKSETEFWICSYANGFGTFNIKTGKYTYIEDHENMPYPLQKGPLFSLFSDMNSTIWMVGARGASYFNPMPSNIKVIDFPPKQIPHSITEILATSFQKISEDKLLVGTSTGDGVYLADLKKGTCKTITEYAGKSFNDILKKQTTTDFYDLQVVDLFKVNENKIWVAIDTQFAYFDVPTESLVFPETTNTDFFRKSRIRHLQLDSKGNMWGINYAKGAMFKASAQTGEIIETYSIQDLLPDELGEEKVYGIWSFYIDSQDVFWMHTYSSVIIRNMELDSTYILNKGIDKHKELTGINFFNVTGGEKGEILLSSYENGLQIIYPNEKMDSFRSIGVEEGLPIQRVLRVRAFKDTYWLATRKGVVAYNSSTSATKIFNSKDGIPNDDLLNYWTSSFDVSEEGEVFFGIPDQFCVLENEEVHTEKIQPNVFFTKIVVQGEEKKFNRNTPLLKRINLASFENFFTVHFSTTNYSFNAKPTFEYRLVGYDDQWHTAGKDRKASFTKVGGGTYTLEVKCTDASGEWGESLIELEIQIDIPFIQSWTFYGLIAFVLLSIGFFVYRFRMSQITEREEMKTDFNRQKAELEMNALRAQMNPHFIFNSLNSINKYILTNEPRIASQYLTKFSRLIRLILSNSKSKEVSLEDELNALSLYVEMEQFRFENKFHFEQEVETTIDLSQLYIPPMLLQPYIENAIWHGLMPLESPGKLTLTISQQKNTLVCTVDDTGIGRVRASELKKKSDIRKKSMGMQITSDRLKLAEKLHNFKTEFYIEDKMDDQGKPAGTKVTLKIPLQKHMEK
ncbi:MAG: histidine kinase [Saprospiraceae bacterium]|nr:histidine kinase [Saprospiraceae bacterium]